MIFEHGDRIVFAGDSVTDMGSACPVGDQGGENLGRSYVRIIDNMLAAWYPERIIAILNAGISGNTSRDLLARWDRDILGCSPMWVSIRSGRHSTANRPGPAALSPAEAWVPWDLDTALLSELRSVCRRPR